MLLWWYAATVCSDNSAVASITTDPTGKVSGPCPAQNPNRGDQDPSLVLATISIPSTKADIELNSLYTSCAKRPLGGRRFYLRGALALHTARHFLSARTHNAPHSTPFATGGLGASLGFWGSRLGFGAGCLRSARAPPRRSRPGTTGCGACLRETCCRRRTSSSA